MTVSSTGTAKTNYMATSVAPPQQATTGQPANPYPNGISIPGTGPNGSSTTQIPVWNAATNSWGIQTPNGIAPIFNNTSNLPSGVSMGQVVNGNGGISGGAPNMQSTGTYGWQGNNQAGSSGTQVSYKLDPTTGYYVPTTEATATEATNSQINTTALENLAIVLSAGAAGGAFSGTAAATSGGGGAALGTEATAANAAPWEAGFTAGPSVSTTGIDAIGASTGAAGATGMTTSGTGLTGTAVDPITGASTVPSNSQLVDSAISGTGAGAYPTQVAGGAAGVPGAGTVIDPTTGLVTGSGAGVGATGGVGGSGMPYSPGFGGSTLPNLPSVPGTGTGTGGSNNSTLSNILGGGNSTVNTMLGLGTVIGGANLIGNKLTSDAASYNQMYKDVAAPMKGLADSQLNQAQTGQLQPWQQASIDRMVASEKASANQFLADSGVGGSQGNAGSTAQLDLNRQIDTNALIQQGQFQQQAITNYTASYGAYAPYLDKGIQAQIASDSELTQLWDGVLSSLAKGMFQAPTSTGGGTSGSGGGSGSSGGINLGSIGSDILSAGKKIYDWITCDRRLKRDVMYFGKDTNTGLNLYLFHYLWDKDFEAYRIGPMADEVLERYPWAVRVDDNGFYQVDFDLMTGHG